MTNLTEKWVNIYKSKEIGSYWSGAFCYETKEEAVKDLADKKNYLTTVNIEDMLNLQTQNTKLKERNDSLNNRDINLCRIANGIRDENFALKELLKECREHFITYKRDDLDKGYVVYDGSYLIAKINQVLGEE